MKFPRILTEVSSTPWAITEEALGGIYKAIEYGLTSEDRDLFHKASENALDVFDGQSEGSKAFVRDGIGYLFVDGPIVPRDSAFSDVSGLTSIQTLTRDFRALSTNPLVDRIYMIVDSPGGAVTGVSEFQQLLASSEKPLIAYNIGQMASAAYWISSAADRIYAVDASLSGSIGVIFRPARFDENAIISTQSPNKWPDTSKPEGKAVVQSRVDDMATVMIEAIAKGRNVTPDFVAENFGAGGVLIASKALEVGMIDGIATLSDLVAGHLDDNAVSTEAPRTEEKRMTKKKSDPDPVSASVEVTADKDAIAAAAVAAERERLQAIEAIKAEFASEDSKIQTAVAAAIDKIKFDASTTVESARTTALKAAFEAQKSLIAEVQTPRRELASQLEVVPTEPIKPPLANDNAMDPKRIETMRLGFAGGKRK